MLNLEKYKTQYRTPKSSFETNSQPKSSIAKFNQAKVKSYFEEQAEKMKSVPGPNKYGKIDQWSRCNIKGGILNKAKHVM